jgi:hypothetical protein
MIRLEVLSLIVITLSLASACDNRSSSGPSCTWQSSSNSGGICRTDVLCSGTQVAASCTDAECTCLVSDSATGERFPADGFCAASESEQTRRVGARCAPSGSADAGSAMDAAVGFAPYCATSPVISGATCTSSAEGDRCPANVYCDACGRNVMATCVCTADSLGYSFACSDPCGSCGVPDAGTEPVDAGPLNACLSGPQCTASSDGSSESIELIAGVCDKVGGTFVASCATDHHDRCVVATYGIVIYTDKTAADYDPVSSREGCEGTLGGVFTP